MDAGDSLYRCHSLFLHSQSNVRKQSTWVFVFTIATFSKYVDRKFALLSLILFFFISWFWPGDFYRDSIFSWNKTHRINAQTRNTKHKTTTEQSISFNSSSCVDFLSFFYFSISQLFEIYERLFSPPATLVVFILYFLLYCEFVFALQCIHGKRKKCFVGMWTEVGEIDICCICLLRPGVSAPSTYLMMKKQWTWSARELKSKIKTVATTTVKLRTCVLLCGQCSTNNVSNVFRYFCSSFFCLIDLFLRHTRKTMRFILYRAFNV